MYEVFSIWKTLLVLSHRSFGNAERLGHTGQDSSCLTLATGAEQVHLTLSYRPFLASVGEDSNHPKAVGQIPPGRGGSRGALVASPGAVNKCRARELLCLG